MRNDLSEAAAPVARPGARTVCEDAVAYRVLGGSADLFVEDVGQAGTMRRLAPLADGHVAFGVSTADTRLVIVPDATAAIEPIAIDDLARQPDILARAVDGWVALIAEHARHMPQPEGGMPAAAGSDKPPTCRLEPGENALAAGGSAIPAGAGTLWCRCVTGEVRNGWGRASAPMDVAVPALRAAPLHAVQDSQLIVLSAADLAREGGLVAALRAFNSALGARLQVRRDRERDAFARRLTRVADADAAALTTAIAELGPNARGSVSGHAVASDPPLIAMMRAVAHAAHATLPSDMSRGGQVDDGEAAIKEIASNAGLRVRQVRLREGWWRNGGEGMVGRLQDGTPVALLPARRGWTMLRPDSPHHIPLDRGAAALVDGHAYVLYRGFDETAASPGRALMQFVLRAVHKDMVLIGVVSLLAGFLGLATPFLSGMMVQSVIPDGVRSEVAQLLLALVAVSFGVIGFELIRGFAVLRIESILGSAIEAALWNRLLRLPVGFFRQFGAGDLALRADAVNQIRRTVGSATITALLSVIFSSVSLVVLLSYGLMPALLAIGVCAVELVILVALALFNMSIQRRALANSGAMQSLTVQIFQGISKLRVAAAESRLLARWTHLFAVDQSLNFRASLVGSGVSAFGAGWNILVMAAVIGLVGFGGAKMSLGDYVTYSAVFGQFVSATLSLAGIIPAAATVIPLWERARPILEEPTEDAGGRFHPGTLRGDIEAVRVGFDYPGGQPALRDVSLRVPAGSFVAIVGPSGSGKSTLLRLLLGFERPDSGQILLDQHDLRDFDTAAVRRQLGVVLQHSRIEAGSLYQNIAGTAPLSMDEALEAATLAGLAPDIAAMPMGLHTYVDDAGATLSGGQRQRLLLARAIARRPRIMLLDEATSALDNATQAHVMETLARMNVTRVVVAHRLSTVRDADFIVVLSEGRVVEQGTYHTLAAAGGLFAELMRRQTS